MVCNVVFSSSAAKEVRDSFVWYENRVEGLGDRFINFIDLTIELILQNPEGFPNKKGPYREAALKIFPYQIIYEYIEEKQTVYILHVFYTKRHPKIKYKRE
ncbi:MAG: type II toxin-antitoxin system RelE/ParE family toxin [Bacteroidota bacterium]|nr:type II toxin-antitoxin system RelE/ParE family toxin [Bacteroidota bacterium]